MSTTTNDTNDQDPSDNQAVIGSQSYFHTWVPFQSGFLSGSTEPDALLSAVDYQARYGLASPFLAQPMGSFLHIGAADPVVLQVPNQASDPQKNATYTNAQNLALNVTQFTDDTRHRAYDEASGDITAGTPPVALQRESQLLHYKGGWRDHTDGNRITTTGGDKIEVIGGNSALWILGRPAVDNAGGHISESSGGLVYDNDAGPGHVEEIRWVASRYPGLASKASGTWMVREKTYMCDDVSIGSGSVREAFVGSAVELSSGDAVSYHGRIGDIPAALKSDPHFNPGASIRRDEQIQTADADPNNAFPYETDLAAAEDFITSVKRNAAATFGSDVGTAANSPALAELTQNIREYAVLDSTLSDTTIKNDVNETTTVGGSTFETTRITGSAVETTTIYGDDTEIDVVDGTLTESSTVGALKTTTVVKDKVFETTTIANDSSSATAIGGTMQEVTVVGGFTSSTEFATSKLDVSIYGVKAELGLSLAETAIWIGFKKREIEIGDAEEWGFDKVQFNAAGLVGAVGELTLTSLVAVTITSAVVNIGGPPVAAAAAASAMVINMAVAPSIP